MCPGQTLNCICATGNSNALAWRVNGNRLEFMSSDPPSTRRNVPGSSTFALLTESSNMNGTRVIMSNLTIIGSSDDIILTCQNVDQSITEPFIAPITGKYNIKSRGPRSLYITILD